MKPKKWKSLANKLHSMLNATWYDMEAKADTDLNYDDYRDGYRLREVLYYNIEKNIATYKVQMQGLTWGMK